MAAGCDAAAGAGRATAAALAAPDTGRALGVEPTVRDAAATGVEPTVRDAAALGVEPTVRDAAATGVERPLAGVRADSGLRTDFWADRVGPLLTL